METTSPIECQLDREVVNSIERNGLPITGVEHRSTDRNVDVQAGAILAHS
jgi:hypothetical protein